MRFRLQVDTLHTQYFCSNPIERLHVEQTFQVDSPIPETIGHFATRPNGQRGQGFFCRRPAPDGAPDLRTEEASREEAGAGATGTMQRVTMSR